jgi:hypothetical protein
VSRNRECRPSRRTGSNAARRGPPRPEDDEPSDDLAVRVRRTASLVAVLFGVDDDTLRPFFAAATEIEERAA